MRNARRFPSTLRHCKKWMPALALACLLSCEASAADVAAANTAPGRHTVTYDRYSLKIDDRRIYVWSGEFHYWRLPSPSLWKDVLQKMKAAGYNSVQIYFDWDYHSARNGVYDFSGVRDVDRLLDMANDVGIYVIARPGPYINAETDGGGLPSWLTAIKGKPRSPAADYTAAYRQWLTHIDAILARHQVTNGTGTVLLYQIENEFYDTSPGGRRYMQDLEQKVRADSITVPLTGNHNAAFQNGMGAVDIPGYDSYPQGFNCSHPQHWKGFYEYRDERKALTRSPLSFPEYQGGAFDTWGGADYDRCRQLTGADFERVFYEANMASGSTMQNFYMTYGGTNWGWLASPGVYTSYDYGAAISEARQLTPKYFQQKLIGYFIQSVQQLAKTDRLATRPPDNAALRLDGRINPDDGTTIYIVRHGDATSTTNDTTHLWLDLSRHAGAATGDATGKKAAATFTRVPQQPGTVLRIDGRDSKLLLAHYRFGAQDLVYSTSELLTHVAADDRDIAVLYGRPAEDGETVLRYDTRPDVRVLDGKVATHWDAGRGELRLNYRHAGLIRVAVQSPHARLLLLIGDNSAAESFWKIDTSNGSVLVRGPHLVRNATMSARLDDASGRFNPSATLELTGDTDRATPIEVFAPARVGRIVWNDEPVHTTSTPSESLIGQLAGPHPVSLPSLAHWKFKAGAPEIAAAYDDSAWQTADRKSTLNPLWDGHLPILDSDVYGFHHGDVWYRGHFTALGNEKGASFTVSLGVHDGNNGQFTAWLNGHYLGTAPSGTKYLKFDAADLLAGKDNVLSVLTESMGHNQEEFSGAYREPRGLIAAALDSSPADIAWKIQGNRGGETPIDSVRGPLNNGGPYGERMGWSLPGYPDDGWQPMTLPNRVSEAGVGWYRTTFSLDTPVDQDAPVGLSIDDNSSATYRALIFINGWQVGRYVNAVGPQHLFPLPAGLLNPHGKNTIAISSWSTGHHGGLGKVSLVPMGNDRTSLRVEPVVSPEYSEETYGK
ncbi:MAG TPA: beta-galactosidase [Rhodanobacter sp.]